MCSTFPWHLLNRTELLQLSRNAGETTAANISHEELVDLMSCRRDVTDPAAINAIDQWRDALMRLVLDYWVSIQTQVSCPAKELGNYIQIRKPGDSRYPVPKGIACYQCPDVRVLACVKNNVAQINELLSRKDNVPATYGVSTRSIDMTSVAAPMQIDLSQIPMEVEKICTMGTFVQVGIARQLGLVHKAGETPQAPPFGGLEASVEESAFRSTPPETRAQWLVAALQMYKGKKAATPAAPAPQPAPAPEAAPAPVVQPAAPPPTRTRTPRTAPQAAPAPAQEPVMDNSAILKFVSDTYGLILEHNNLLSSLRTELAMHTQSLNELKGEHAELKRHILASMHISASLGQAVFGAMPEEIIAESSEYADKMMGK